MGGGYRADGRGGGVRGGAVGRAPTGTLAKGMAREWDPDRPGSARPALASTGRADSLHEVFELEGLLEEAGEPLPTNRFSCVLFAVATHQYHRHHRHIRVAFTQRSKCLFPIHDGHRQVEETSPISSGRASNNSRAWRPSSATRVANPEISRILEVTDRRVRSSSAIRMVPDSTTASVSVATGSITGGRDRCGRKQHLERRPRPSSLATLMVPGDHE